MLHLILGTAGTGKSTLLSQRIAQDVADARRAFLIIPEQQANLSERTMLPRLPESSGLTFSITGFTRLYDRVASLYGGISTNSPDRSLGLLLLWQCLRELSPVLEEYGSADQSAHELISVKKAENDPKYVTHHDLKCEVCGKIIKEAEHDLGPENHLGLKPCIDCWYTPDPNVGPHECTGGKATCCEKATCSICGEEYGETDKNAHTYLDSWGYYDDEGHAKNCIACGERSAIEAHEVSEDSPTQCSICGYYVKEQSFGEKMLKAAPIAAAAAGGIVTTGGASVGVFFLIRKLFFLK
jgi:hypothetical protein